jgi:glutathione S-transferase
VDEWTGTIRGPDPQEDKMPTLYGVARSRASRNIWLADEIGLALTRVPVVQGYRLPDAQAADAPMNTASAAFLALSPAGAIPVLEDEGLVLTESLAINLYLAGRYGGDLGPRDAAEAAQMTQWALYGATAAEPDALALLYAHGEGRGDAPEVAGHVAALQRPLRVIEGHLAMNGQMVGHRFTVADINMAEILRYAQAHPGLIEGFAAIHGWMSACQSRPAFHTMMAARLAEPA